MKAENLTYEQNSELRGRVFRKSLIGTHGKIKRCLKIYKKLEGIVLTGKYKETIYWREHYGH